MIRLSNACFFACAALIGPSWMAAAETPDLSAQTAQEITAEATRPQTPEAGRALPLAAPLDRARTPR